MQPLYALALTLLCELPIILLLARKLPVTRVIIVALLASLLTHPLAWKIAALLSPLEYPIGVWIIEACVVLIEALWYQFWLATHFSKSLTWSFIANATSFAVGWLVLS